MPANSRHSTLSHILSLPFFILLTFLCDNHEPFSLALLFALAECGFSPALCSAFYLLSAVLTKNPTKVFIFLTQTAILCASFYAKDELEKRKDGSYSALPFIALGLALLVFVFLAPFNAYVLPVKGLELFQSAILQKTVFAFAIYLFSATSLIGLRAAIFKLLKCRLSGEEIIFLLLFLFLVGLSTIKFAGIYLYLGLSYFLLLIYAAVTKDATTLFAAFLFGLPARLLGGVDMQRFFTYGVLIASSVKLGRLPAVCLFLSAWFLFAYTDGVFLANSVLLAPSLISAILPTVLFILLPSPLLRSMENKLVFYREKHLSRIAINRNRAAIGERLFEISGVFREIQSTFHALGGTEAEENAKEFICRQTIGSVCVGCNDYKKCLKANYTLSLRKLVDVGAAKGRVSLLDVPTALAEKCNRQSDLLYTVNRLLGDYHKHMLEAENAAEGRALLAGQAQGMSEILKNLALAQSEPITLYSDKEKQLSVAFLKAGIVCSEILVSGEDKEFTLSLVTFGNADVKKISAVASAFFDMPMLISERISLSKDKFCCILKRRPKYDAAFGVANLPKSGEHKSGDTHSVIKIDERKFMVALSDGMGSGAYAQRISECTISLLESFYKAKMPSNTVLSTVNKLLTFSKEESFACVDIALIDLDTGSADIVKIGSPSGFILSGSTLKILESATLPLGILESLRPVTASHVLLENDVLLFLSDGITSAFPSTTDLYEILKTIPSSNPQLLAEGLLQKALEGYGGKAMDDMTALAVRLYAA